MGKQADAASPSGQQLGLARARRPSASEGRRVGPAAGSPRLERLPPPQYRVTPGLALPGTREPRRHRDQGTRWGRSETQKEGIGAAADNGLKERLGLEGTAGTRSERGGGLKTSGKRGSRAKAEGVGPGRRAGRGRGWGTPRWVRIGFQPHLKSLSLDVIFSSKLEIWYEALAMLTASIPPAGAVAAAARCRGCWGSSSRLPRLPLPGSQRDADADWRRLHRMPPPRRDVSLSRGKQS